MLYLPSTQSKKVLAAFHESVSRTDSDSYAAGPLVSFSSVHDVGFQLLAVGLVYTKLPENPRKWPVYWQKSSFSKLWRFWSTCKVRSLSSATDELNFLNPPGKCQVFGNTTIKNDAATIAAAHAAYDDGSALLRRVKVKGLVWTLVLQPLLADWIKKGDPNPLGLENSTEHLVNVSMTVLWNNREDEASVKSVVKKTFEQIKAFATAHQTQHPWKYLNYCSEWQKPFEGYGRENLDFLKQVSRKHDPDGLFQKGCVGGFKLDLEDQASSLLL